MIDQGALSPGYAGADWIESAFKVQLSPLGRTAANLLGDAFFGIYHLRQSALRNTNWGNPHWVEITLYGDLATFDSDALTRLVVLAHDRCVRLQVRGVGPGCMKLGLSPRDGREGRMYSRHPTMEDAVAAIRRDYSPCSPTS